MKNYNHKLLLYIVLFSLLVTSGCGKKEESVSGQDYVEVEPILEDESDTSNNEVSETDGVTDVTDVADDYFAANSITCTADKTFSIPALINFTDAEGNVIENDIFSVDNAVCNIYFGDCSRVENSEKAGTVDITVTINGEIEADFEENTESDGTAEFDFSVNCLSFDLADKYSGEILDGSNNINDFQSSGNRQVMINGTENTVSYTVKTEWKSSQWSEWLPPSETNGYVSHMKWPFVKVYTINVSDDYDGLVLVTSGKGFSESGLDYADNTGKYILEAQYGGNIIEQADIIAVDILSLLN